MPLEQQVCSLELSKELKELGFPQESLYYWFVGCVTGNTELRIDKVSAGILNLTNSEVTSAPTVAELGEELAMVEREKVLEAYGYVVGAIGTQIITTAGLVMAMHRPDMGAKMLIYLLKNKLIELK